MSYCLCHEGCIHLVILIKDCLVWLEVSYRLTKWTVIKQCIFQLLPVLCYINWQSTINFKIKSWHEWLYSNKWITKTFNVHIKNNPAITFQLYFTYFQATKHSWQLFMKRHQCAKMCSVWNNNFRKKNSIEMYFKNKIKENKVTELESFKAVSSSYLPLSPIRNSRL